MSKLTSRAAALTVAILLVGCGQNDRPWVDLPTSPNAGYITSVKTYGGDDAVRPFDVRVKSKTAPFRKSNVFQASQCKNVDILPRANDLYVFYDELVVTEYHNSRFDGTLPRPFLCDIRHKFCSDLLQAAISAKEPVFSVCTSS